MGTSLVVKQFGSVEAAKKYAGNILSAVADISDFDGKPILKLSEDGDWTYGAEGEPISEDDLLAVNPRTLRHGFIAFDSKRSELAFTIDGDPAEVIVDISEAIYADELPELEMPKRGDPPRWQKQVILEMVIVDGPNKGVELVYKPTSMGGKRMAAKIAKEIARRIEAGTEDFVPVIEVFSSFYYNKRFGREIAVPEHAIVNWYTINDTELRPSTEEDEDAAETDEKAEGSGRNGKRTATDRAKTRRAREQAAETDDEGDEDAAEERGRGARADNARGGRSRARDEVRAGKRGRAADRSEDDDADEDGDDDERETYRDRRGSRERSASERDRRAGSARNERRGRPAGDAEPDEAEDGGEDEEQPRERGSRRSGGRADSSRDRSDDRDRREPVRGARAGGRDRDRSAPDRAVSERQRGRSAGGGRDAADEAEGPRGRRAASGGRGRR